MVEKVPQQQMSETMTKLLSGLHDFRHGGSISTAAQDLESKITAHSIDREKYYNTLSQLRDNWVVNGIYDIVFNDVFLPNEEGIFFKIKVPGNPDIEKELNQLMVDLNIFSLIESTFPELLHNGAYPYSPVITEGTGLVALLDKYYPSEVICVTDLNNAPVLFCVASNKKMAATGWVDYSRNSYKFLSISDLLYLTLDLDTVKLNLPEKIVDQIRSQLPDDVKETFGYGFKIKQSKSFIWPARDKITQTLLLDKVQGLKSIAGAISPTIVGIPVPDVYDVTKLASLTKNYDELINGNISKLANPDNPNIALGDIASVKVVPIAGTRSIPQTVDSGQSSRTIDTETVVNALSNALNTLGIPLDLFMGNPDTSPKQNIRINSRYAKKIKRIGQSVSRFIKTICLLHLSAKYQNIEMGVTDISVLLKNNCNADELDNLEPQDLLLSGINNIIDTFVKLDSIMGPEGQYRVNVNELALAVQSQLKSIGSPYSESIVNLANNTDPEVPIAIIPNQQEEEEEGGGQ